MRSSSAIRQLSALPCKVLQLLVVFYRRFISPLKPRCCRFVPTCSEYALQALRCHGAWRGLLLILWRLSRCHPFWHGDIYDPVPQSFLGSTASPGKGACCSRVDLILCRGETAAFEIGTSKDFGIGRMSSKNSKYDMVTVIGVACSIIALVSIIMYRPGAPAKSQSDAAQSSQVKEVSAVQQNTAAPVETAASASASAASPIVAAQVADVTAPRSKGEAGTAVLQNQGKMETSIDLAGNGCVGVVLPDYLIDIQKSESVEKPAPVELSSYDYPFLCITADWIGKYGLGEANRVAGTASNVVKIQRKSADGKLQLIETWTLQDEATYKLAYSVEIINSSSEAIALSGSYIEGGSMPISVTPSRKSSRGESAGGLTLCGIDGETESLFMRDLAKMKENKRQKIESMQTKWTAVHSKYFLLSMWLEGDGHFAGAEVAQVPAGASGEAAALTGPRYHVRAKMAPVILEGGKSVTWNIQGYAGPKKFSILSNYGMRLESVMEMDRFFFWRPRLMSLLSEYLLKMLIWLSDVFPKSLGYGLGIILLTVLVKVIFWPLSHKSTKSMRKMAELKPQLDELRAKYKDDPQTMYRKQQELFKQNNVSQLGGCLPMLLQIPVFFALFNTFRNAIELRHASFLWAYDLSMPDTLSFSPEHLPIRPLALLMGGLMYFQQKLTPNPDPQQAKMMSYMSIFFILLFYGMPSALTLYLSVSYLLGIVQTVVTNKMMPPISAQPVKK